MSRAVAIYNNLRSLDVPVLRQEMRVRQRGIKPFGVMFIYVAILTLLALFVLNESNAFIYQNSYGPQQSASSQSELARTGRQLFSVISFTQLVMILLIVPSYSAGTISSEREKGTFDLLALTLLGSSSIVTQKLVAAMAQAAMLLLSSLPIVGVVFLLGGVSPLEVFTAYLILFTTAAMVSSFGVLSSCLFSYSRSSTFTTYLGVFLFFAGMQIIAGLLPAIREASMMKSATGIGLLAAGMLLFCGGIITMFIYGPIVLYMKYVSSNRFSRAFKMGVFGVIFAVVLMLLIAPPSVQNASISMSQSEGLFFPLYVNAFTAMSKLLEASDATAMSGYPPGYGPMPGPGAVSSYSAEDLSVILTICFSVGCAYLLRQLSTAKFESMRRP